MGVEQPVKLPSLLFRVDGDESVALGHLRRCISVAQKIRLEGVSVCFLGHFDSSGVRLLASNGFGAVYLQTSPCSPVEAERLVSVARTRGIRRVVIDSYNVDNFFFQKLREMGIETFYFEDFGEVEWLVDGIINGRVGAEEIPYKARYVMAGARYSVLPREFKRIPIKNVGRNVKRILLTLGGIDHYDLSSRIISIFGRSPNLKDIELNVVIGPYFSNKAEIDTAVTCVDGYCQVKLHQGLSSLVNLMLECDIAISAGGTTLTELAVAGVPCIGLALWPNQIPNVLALASRGALLPIDFQRCENFDHQLVKFIDQLINDHELRSEMSTSARQLIGGNGASRVAHSLLEHLDPSTFLPRK